MPTQPTPALEIDATFDDIGQKTGRFEFPGGDKGSFSIESEIRNGLLLNSAFDDLAAGLSDKLDIEDTNRKGLDLGVGGGEHAIMLQFQTPGPVDNPDTGSAAQWGSSSNPTDGPNRHTATGADATQQMQVFMEYLRVASPDSLLPARLYWGEYAPAGELDDYLSVAIEQPSISAGNTQHGRFDGSMTLVETIDYSETGGQSGDRFVGVSF